MRAHLAVAAAVLASLFLVACPTGEQPQPPPSEDAGTTDDADHSDDATDEPIPSAIEFPTDRFVIEQNSPTEPQAEVLDEGGEVIDDAAVSWASADPAIIEISSGGLAIGQELGETELIASVGDLEKAWPAEVVGSAVASVSVIPENTSIIVGQQLPYGVVLRDDGNNRIDDERPVDWSSSDTDVATIDGDGMVTGVSEGTAEITAVVEGVEDTAQLAVEDVDLDFLEISPAMVGELVVGQAVELEATVYDVNGEPLEDALIDWSSSDDEVAEVSEGIVEAVGSGDATITASFEELEDSIDVEVVPVSIDDITAGGGFVCITAGQRAYCAGEGGKLGDGTAVSSESTAVEVAFDGDTDVEEISAGRDHACLLDTDGDVYCWGDNDAGQLGVSAGDTEYSPVEADVDGAFRAISAGDAHTCGVTESDEVYCWGDNTYRQLGSTNTDESGPIQVVGDVDFEAVTAGGRHTCAIGVDDSGYCWGDNTRLQLGGGTGDDSSADPVLVDGGYEFGSISAGGDHTCGTDPSGPPVCWGAGERGQLGYDGDDDRGVPVNIALDAGESLLAVDAGDEHTCAITSEYQLRCWGAHDDGRLAVDVGEDATSPQAGFDQQIEALATGESHGCALAADDGELLCWGDSPGTGHVPVEVYVEF